MTNAERFLLYAGAIVALLALCVAGYNFFAGRELTRWATSLHHQWNTTVTDHGHGPGDHIGPPPPPPKW